MLSHALAPVNGGLYELDDLVLSGNSFGRSALRFLLLVHLLITNETARQRTLEINECLLSHQHRETEVRLSALDGREIRFQSTHVACMVARGTCWRSAWPRPRMPKLPSSDGPASPSLPALCRRCCVALQHCNTDRALFVSSEEYG